MTLKGKVAIVTGGNTGIGKAVVLALAEAGANIVIDYIADEAATEELEKQIVALGDQAIGVMADVSKVDDLRRLIAAGVDAFGRLDIMVNNAGVETRTSVLETTEQQYDKVLDINLKSAFFGTQLAAKQMIAQGNADKMKTLNAAIPLGRMAQPQEIGSVVAFLAGDGASYLTATTIFADGGIMQSSPGL